MNTRLSPDATHIAASDGHVPHQRLGQAAVVVIRRPVGTAARVVGAHGDEGVHQRLQIDGELLRDAEVHPERQDRKRTCSAETRERCQTWQVLVRPHGRQRERAAPMMTAAMKQTVTISAVPKRRTRSARGKYGASRSPSGMKPAPT